jgi:uncharacterized membrane protein YjjP (DUF1212 family)
MLLLATSATNGFGDLIMAVFWIVMGVWLLYAWPRSIHRKIVSGKLGEEDGTARLRRLSPKTGYVAILLGICLACAALFQLGFFDGIETILGASMLAFSFGLLGFALWRMRKAKR